jgi:hypothetical protein
LSQIVLGKSAGKSVSIDLELLLRTRLLVQANSGGGKSYLLRRLAEQLFGKVQVIIIDREGEFSSLREKFGYLHVGKKADGADTDADVRSAKLLAEKILELKVSAVCDLFEAFRSRPLDRRAWVADFLNALLDAPRSMWRDLVVIVDEAHQFAPQENPKAASMAEREIISRCKEAMIGLATVGRKRGYASVWATQRLAKLDKDATAELFNRLIGMTVEDVDVDRAVDLMSVSRENRTEFKESLRNLEPGNFYGFGRAISKTRILLKVGPVQTKHPEPGAQKQPAGPPPVPEKIRHLLPRLEDLPKEAETKARTEAELKAEIRLVKTQLAAAHKELALEKNRPAPAPPRKPAPASIIPPAAKPKIVKVDVPMVSPRVVKRLETLSTHITKSYEKLAQVVTAFNGTAKDIRDSVARVAAVDSMRILESRTRAILSRQGAGPINGSAGSGTRIRPSAALARPTRSRLQPVHRLAAKSIPDAAGPDPATDDRIPNPQLRILTSLVQFETIGITEVPRPMLAGWMGLKGGGSYMNNLGSLSTRGLIRHVVKSVQLTDAGRAMAPPSDEEITTEGLLKHCLDAVSGPQGQILSHLHRLHPDWTTRAEVADALGLKGGGSFMNNLGSLHVGCMIDYDPQRGTQRVKCADWLFVLAESSSPGRGRR